MLKNFINRTKNVLNGDSGASNVEIIVWISVVLVLATVLFLFRDSISAFIKKATNRTNSFQAQ